MKPVLLPEGLWPVMLTPFKLNGSIDYYSIDALIEFYLDHGASGLFANCLSSEMYHLTPKERIDLVKYVAKKVKGRVPVVASGTFGMNLTSHIKTIKILYNLDVQAVVLVVSQIARVSENEEILKIKLDRILEGTGSIPLGLYECPEPYKRLLSPEMLGYLAKTNRFLYFKDTSCDSEEIKERLYRLKNSSIGLFNANTPTALQSLRDGARGLSTVAANFYPELYTLLCNMGRSPALKMEADLLQHYLTLMDAITRIKYPLSAKIFLSKRGLRIYPYTRVKIDPIHPEELMILEALFKQYKFVLNEFKQ
jgi:4-hydroxy-tetrahydrodipicolinate synthase